jgi:hypothetical protein
VLFGEVSGSRVSHKVDDLAVSDHDRRPGRTRRGEDFPDQRVGLSHHIFSS